MLSKRCVLLLLTALILNALIVHLSHPLMYGIETISGTDEIRHLDRAFAIYNEKIDVYHKWGTIPNAVVDLYPGGLHVFIVEFMHISKSTDPYIILLIMKILYTLGISLLMFIIGRKIHPYLGLLAVFYYINMVHILVNLRADYTWLIGSANFFNTTQITLITILTMIYVMIEILVFKREKIGKFLIIFLICSSVHQASHISTYITSLYTLSALFLVGICIAYIKRTKDLLYRWSALLITLYLSVPVGFLLYYWKMFGYIDDYTLSKFLPDIISIFPIKTAILFVCIFFLLVLPYPLYYILKKPATEYTSENISKNRYIPMILSLSYLILYVLIIFLVNIQPSKYVGGGTPTTFTTYIPHQMNVVTLPSVIGGMIFFFLSLAGIYILLNKNEKYRFISYIILTFFMVWVIDYVIMHYYAHRTIRMFQFVLPFIYAGVVFSSAPAILSSFNISPNFSKLIKFFVIIIIPLLFLSANISSQINKDPAIVYPEYKENIPFRFGEPHPPLVTPELTVAVKYYCNGEIILTQELTYQPLYILSSIDVPDISYPQYWKESMWGTYINALSGKEPDKFFREYDSHYVVKKYDRDMLEESLYILYQNRYNEQICIYTG